MYFSIPLTLNLLLRVSVFGTFLGHGLTALLHPPVKWYQYVSNTGLIGQRASTLIQAIGVMDCVVAGLSLASLSYNIPYLHLIYAWAAAWGVATAFARVLNNEGVLEFVERAGNFIPAFALAVQLNGEQRALQIVGISLAILAAAGIALRVTFGRK